MLIGAGNFERKILRSAPKKVIEEMHAEGWTIEATGGGHVKWRHPSGALVYSAATPSDRRAWNNHLSQMRRAKTRLGDAMKGYSRYSRLGATAEDMRREAWHAQRRGDVAPATRCLDWDEHAGVCLDEDVALPARRSSSSSSSSSSRSADLSWDVATAAGAAWGAYIGAKYEHPYVGAALGAAGPMLLHWIIDSVKT
jgi:predicted RNA binding protein YcfA (HicA-like mRNA interferase family)